jgi:hypothetical protein
MNLIYPLQQFFFFYYKSNIKIISIEESVYLNYDKKENKIKKFINIQSSL